MEQIANKKRSVAYFSMEIGIDEKICTYSGGLGVLAGDTIRSNADLRETCAGMDENILTIAFARRVATYKRADLLFRDMARLKRISNEVGKIQIIYGGKAHPRDHEGKELIKRIFWAKNDPQHDIKVAYLENYNMTLGAMITSGVDLWLNTPEPPMEASGTSGMKASLNGIPNLSVLDGWWIEGRIEGLTGWSIGEPVHGKGEERDHSLVVPSLYDKLGHTVVPLFYHERHRFMDMMAYSIAIPWKPWRSYPDRFQPADGYRGQPAGGHHHPQGHDEILRTEGRT
ncbi:MAG: alpha-glucan family phosphorylase [Desulfobacterales bacterium]